MVDSGLAHLVDAFSSRVDDLHTGGILPVVYPSDCPITWSANVHNVKKRSQIYGTLLEELPEGHGDMVDDEHSLSPTNRWSVGEDHIVFRVHAASICPGGYLGGALTLSGIRLQQQLSG